MGKNDKKQSKTSQVFKNLKRATDKGGDALGKVTKAHKASQKAASTAKALQAKKTVSTDNQNVFQEQLSLLGKRLFGKRFTKVATVVSCFIPEGVLNKASERTFLEVARLAEQWSKIDLPQGMSLDDNTDIDAAQRKALVSTIANQNRVLAAAGSGVTGLTGLIGTIADLLWLLLVSLRLIYQTASVNGHKLTGIDGAKRAFSVLAESDLSMLTEKQAVLVSMGAASQLVDDADLQVLQGLVDENNNIAFFQETIQNIAQQFNLSFNFDWLMKILPIAAGVTSAVYSVYIINEVSATASLAFQTKDVVSD